MTQNGPARCRAAANAQGSPRRICAETGELPRGAGETAISVTERRSLHEVPRARRGNSMLTVKTVKLETVCGITSTLPDNTLPEIALAGKSNVGKSTLINGIVNRRSYARTSANPGKTQTINFYNVNEAFYLVDLPGYGYATAGLEARKQWGRMIENYLGGSKMLRAVFLLLDIRHEPSENDVMMYDWILQAGFEPVIIATKADKLRRSQLEKQKKFLADTLAAKSRIRESGRADMRVLGWSGLTKTGREEILELLDGLLGGES